MSRRGWALFGAMAVIWGIPYLLIRVAVRQLDPGVLVFGRTLPAAILLVPLVIARNQFALLWSHLKWIAIFAIIEFGIPWYLMATSERHITSSLTSLLICAVPLFSVVGQRVRRTEDHVTPRRLLGLAIGAVGVALLVCLGYSIGPVILATKLQHIPGVVVVAGATSVVALCWIPWTIAHWPRAISAETWTSVAVLSVVCTAGAFLTFFELIKEVGSTRSVVVTYVNTAIAVVLGVVFLNEPLTIGIMLGFPLVLVGSIFATSSKRSSVVAELA